MAKATKALVPILLSLLLLAMGCARKPPTITGITPDNGPSGGGTAIRIVGENFKEGAVVTIADTPVKNMVISPEGTSVTATTPGGPPGAQKVIATNLKAKEPSLPATFTYNPLTVVDNDPPTGAQLPWYPRATQASATFSQPVQTGSASISISGVAGEVMYDASTKTATFTASEPLPTGASYEVTVSGAKDMAGNTMSEYKFSFSIEEAVKVVWYTVQEGDTLESIAAKPEVYEASPEDDEAWKRILAANQDEFVSEDGKHGNDVILNPKKLTAGMVLYIPR